MLIVKLIETMLENKSREFRYYRGRVGLYAILQALGIGKGDEVATQAFTCIAVPEAIMAAGARPLYIDLESAGFNMDASDLESKITSKTRAIIVQHTFGIPADLDRIVQVARQNGIPIIEDCCHTLATRYKGKIVGTFGVGSFYSYEWGKPLVVGIGGSVLINDIHLMEKVKNHYSSYQSPPKSSCYRLQLQYLAHKLLYRPSLYWKVKALYHFLGKLGAVQSNYNPIKKGSVAKDFSLKMPKTLQKRLIEKIKTLDSQTQHSRWVVAEYQSKIKSALVSHPIIPLESDTVFARYPMIAKDKSILIAKACDANVELADWYSTPIHPLCKNEWSLVHYEPGSCQNAETRCEQVVTLPVHGAVKKNYIERVVEFLNESQE